MSGAELWERSVAWRATGDGEFPYQADDGGTRYVLRVNDFPAEALYTLLADGTEVAELDDWPAAWARPARPANLREIAARELERTARRTGRRLVDLGQIAAWADALCRTAETGTAEVVAALGLPGQVVEHTAGAATLEPPPLGSTRLTIGRYRGAFADLGVTLAASTITRADLDARFGPGRPVPMAGAGRDWQLAYRIEHPGAPHAVTLFASFQAPPGGTSVTTRVLLRRERALPGPPGPGSRRGVRSGLAVSGAGSRCPECAAGPGRAGS